MKTKSKLLLTISLTTFALGFTNVLWGLGMPIGAICFGLFMVFRILEKETELFDQEEQQRLARANQVSRQSPQPFREESTVPFTTAISHSR